MRTFSTAMDMQKDLHSRINALVLDSTETKTYRDLAALSSLSQTRIRYFHKRLSPNLLAESMDDLASAVTIYERIRENEAQNRKS